MDILLGVLILFGIPIFFIWIIISNKKSTKKLLEKRERRIAEKQPKTILRKVKEFDCVVTGSQFDSSNGVPREIYIDELQEFDPLELQPEPANEFDKNAILVLFDGKDIGYVPKMFSKKISDFLKEGKRVEAFVKKKYKKEKYLNCVMIIEIYEEQPK
jgi:hypothetical protein